VLGFLQTNDVGRLGMGLNKVVKITQTRDIPGNQGEGSRDCLGPFAWVTCRMLEMPLNMDVVILMFFLRSSTAVH
jgi:hypothetical protein